MRAADEKRCASGTLAQQEAEKAAGDSHHTNAIDLTGELDVGNFDFGDDLIILDDEPSGSTGPRASNSTDSQLSSSRPGANQHRPPGVNVLTKPRPPPIKKATKPMAGSGPLGRVRRAHSSISRSPCSATLASRRGPLRHRRRLLALSRLRAEPARFAGNRVWSIHFGLVDFAVL